MQHLLDGLLLKVQLNGDAVTVRKDLIALLLQQPGQRRGVGPLGDGGADIAVIVKHGQPCAHAVRHAPDVPGIDLVSGQLVDDILTGAGFIHKADKGGAQLHIGNILGHIAADAAVYLLDPACVAPARYVGGQRIPLNIHKNSTDHNNTHGKVPHL